MSSNSNECNAYIIKSILANNEFGILEVNGTEVLSSRYFLKNQYAEIVTMIRNGDTKAIKSLADNSSTQREYLDVLIFRDQRGNKYIVTVYDSDDLIQDPQVIEIFHCV